MIRSALLSGAVLLQAAGPSQACMPREPAPYPSKYPWALEAHNNQLAGLPPDADVLLLGDSHASTWPAELFAPFKVVNAAIGGDLVQHVRWRLQSDRWKTVKPSVVIVAIGSNNLAGGECTFGIAQGVVAVVDRLRELWPQARVLYLTMPPRGARGLHRQNERLMLNNVLARNVTMLSAGDLERHMLADDIHLSPEAYRALTRQVLQLL